MSKTIQATVKVMLSYDYCHFEVSKTIEYDPQGEGPFNELTNKEIDEARKDCQRLADKAVGQYKAAKAAYEKFAITTKDVDKLKAEVSDIKTRPENQWSPYDKAKVKTLEDWRYDRYNYMDDDEYTI
jgi:hypothetical protein